MSDLIRRLALIVLIAVPLAGVRPTLATPAPEDRAVIERVETYLNGIRTLRSRFLQAADDGSLARGTLHISRPGKMRLEYDPPIEDYVVADGWFIYYWDAELEQQTNAPLGSTLASLLLRENLSLTRDVRVVGLMQGAGSLEVTLVDRKDPSAGQLTLIFEDKPLRLRKWRVLDAQGAVTEVALLDPQIGVELDPELFHFYDPNFGKRLND